jgi:tetratricopeptide (TPR) repeat protein
VTGPADLFSAGLVDAYVDDPYFVTRPWIAEQVDLALASPDCRFLLLTGAPGIGKTAAMAWLAGRYPASLRYFIRRDSQNLFSSGDAQSFLLSLGHQFAARFPAAFRPDRLNIVVRQRIDRVAPGGRVVGISIDDLIVSPFRRTALMVEQDASLVEGELAGIRAERAVANDRLLSLDTLLYLALIDPAEVLRAELPTEQILIFLDGLDELRYRRDEGSILDWLAGCPPLPENIRFVVTSREDEALLRGFRARQREWLRNERIDGASERFQPDALRYAAAYTKEPTITDAISRHASDAKSFVTRAVTKAAGNFQYISALCGGIKAAVGLGNEEAVAQLVTLDELPEDLESLYSYFIDLIAAHIGQGSIGVDPLDLDLPARFIPAWDGLYQPVLGLLASARAPLSVIQLARFIDNGESRYDYQAPVEAAIRGLAQFLRREGEGLLLYHSTFTDYVTGAGGQVHGIKVEDAHRRIARSYRAGQPGWDTVRWAEADNYGLAHLVEHLVCLADAGAIAFAEVEALLCRPLMREKIRRFGSYTPFAADVRYALDAISRQAADSDPVLNLPGELRLRWLAGKLKSLASAVSPDLIAVVARTGAAPQALGLADLITSVSERFAAYLATGVESAKAGQLEASRIALSVACSLLEENAPTGSYPLYVLLDGYARLGDPDGVARAAAIAERLTDAKVQGQAVASVVVAYATLGVPAQCSAWAQRLSPSSDVHAAAVARALVRAGLPNDAVNLAARCMTPRVKSCALAAASAEIALQEHFDQAAELAARALELDPAAAYRDAFAALCQSGRRSVAAAAAEGFPPGMEREKALLALAATQLRTPGATAEAGRALDALIRTLHTGRWPADQILEVVPDLVRVGDLGLLRKAFSVGVRLPDDAYGSSGKLVAAFAEAFAAVGDQAGIDSAFEAMTRIDDNTHRSTALTGLARACVDACYRVDDVRAAGRRLHRHFIEPWAIDVEVAMCLAEAGQTAEAQNLADSLLDELQRPNDVRQCIEWRRIVADNLVACGLTDTAVSIGAAALRLCESLVVSSDENEARLLVPRWDQLNEPFKTRAVAEGMEWKSVVDAAAPVLEMLGKTRSEEAMEKAFQRIESLVQISWPHVEAVISFLGAAAIAILESGYPAKAVETLALLYGYDKRGMYQAVLRWPKLVQMLVATGAANEAAQGARLAQSAADDLADSEAHGWAAVACDAAGLLTESASELAKATDGKSRSQVLEQLAQQALDRGDILRARQLIEELLTITPDDGIREPYLLARAARTLARIGDGIQAAAMAGKALVRVGPDFPRADLLPEILGPLGEAAVQISDAALFARILGQADALGGGEWGRRAVRAVASAASTRAPHWLAGKMAADDLQAYSRVEISLATAMARAESLVVNSQDIRTAISSWRTALTLDQDADSGRLTRRFADASRLLALSGASSQLEEMAHNLAEIDSWWTSGAWMGGQRFF